MYLNDWMLKHCKLKPGNFFWTFISLTFLRYAQHFSIDILQCISNGYPWQLQNKHNIFEDSTLTFPKSQHLTKIQSLKKFISFVRRQKNSYIKFQVNAFNERNVNSTTTIDLNIMLHSTYERIKQLKVEGRKKNFHSTEKQHLLLI